MNIITHCPPDTKVFQVLFRDGRFWEVRAIRAGKMELRRVFVQEIRERVETYREEDWY